jgi:hypothetical protein
LPPPLLKVKLVVDKLLQAAAKIGNVLGLRFSLGTDAGRHTVLLSVFNSTSIATVCKFQLESTAARKRAMARLVCMKEMPTAVVSLA